MPAEEHGGNILVVCFSQIGNTAFNENVRATTSANVDSIDGKYMGNAPHTGKLFLPASSFPANTQTGSP